MKHLYLLILYSITASYVASIHSFVTAKFTIGSHGNPETFQLGGNAKATAFHKKTGTWVIGADIQENTGAVISYVKAANGSNIQEIIGHLGFEQSGYITHIALSENVNTEDFKVIFAHSSDTSKLHLTSLTNNTIGGVSNTILDKNGENSSGVVAIAASDTKAFVAIKSNGTNGTDGVFGEIGSGIALLTINDDGSFTQPNTNTSVFEITANLPGIRVSSVHFPTIYTDLNPALYWSPDLERLYLGIQGRVNAGSPSNAIQTLLCFKQNGNTLENVPVLNIIGDPTPPLPAPATIENPSNIIVGGGGSVADYSITKLDVMKTTTGHYYLIINGGLDGNGYADASNKIFALPLVESGDDKGALAQVIRDEDDPTIITRINFDTAATNYITEMMNENDKAAKVGSGSDNWGLPSGTARDTMTHMCAVGDTVFCSVRTIDEGHEAGIFYSQAIFDINGHISSWTYWNKAVPNQVSGDNETITDGGCFSFAVDPIRGKIWTIPFNDKTKINVTQWTYSESPDDFDGSVNALLQGPCFSQFNLHQQILNWGHVANSRFAFFGGDSKVIVVRTGYAQTNDTDYTALERPTRDWATTNAKATDISVGLENTGAITCFGWTNQFITGEKKNYLLAGTNNGLYALVNDNNNAGFGTSPETVSDFQGYRWKKISALGNDPIHKIVTCTTQLTPQTFVITHGYPHKLWRLKTVAANDFDVLNASAECIFKANPADKNILASATFFKDIATTTTDENGIDTIALLTDQGIYVFINPEAAPEDLTAICLRPLGYQEFTSIFQTPRTFLNNNFYLTQRTHPSLDNQLTSTSSYLNHYAISLIHDTNPILNTCVILAQNKIAIDDSVISTAPPIKNFYTNGACRLFSYLSESSESSQYRLGSIPFYNGASDYNATSIFTPSDPALTDRTIYWIAEMGAGYLMIGTNKGIISLR